VVEPPPPEPPPRDAPELFEGLDVVVAAGCEGGEEPPAPRDSKPNSRSGAELLDDEDEVLVVRCWLGLRGGAGVDVTLATAMVRGLEGGADVVRWVVVRRCACGSDLDPRCEGLTIGGSGSNAVATQ
jgi:hypothetical protein